MKYQETPNSIQEYQRDNSNGNSLKDNQGI